MKNENVKTKNILGVSVIAGFLLLLAFSAHAQEANVAVNITPGEPHANEEVRVGLNSSSVNLDAAKITWTLNGKKSAEGVGLKNFTFKTSALGTTSRIQVVITGPAEVRIERSFSVRPAEVDLLWEAVTYTPPLYRGKALPSSKSKIKIVAIPHFVLENGRRVSEDALLFTWEQDRTVLGSLSGVGKQSIILDAPRLFEETRISVLVSTADGTREARGEVLITLRNPEILFYEKHPTEGVRYENALASEIELAQEEMAIRAEPYFFSEEDISSRRVHFAWSLNNAAILPPERMNEMVLRREVSGGVARLTLQAQNAVKILQEAVANLLIKF